MNATPVRKAPALPNPIRQAADELVDEASMLAEFSSAVAKELDRAQQWGLLAQMADIGRQIRRTTAKMVRSADKRDKRKPA